MYIKTIYLEKPNKMTYNLNIWSISLLTCTKFTVFSFKNSTDSPNATCKTLSPLLTYSLHPNKRIILELDTYTKEDEERPLYPYMFCLLSLHVSYPSPSRSGAWALLAVVGTVPSLTGALAWCGALSNAGGLARPQRRTLLVR